MYGETFHLPKWNSSDAMRWLCKRTPDQAPSEATKSNNHVSGSLWLGGPYPSVHLEGDLIHLGLPVLLGPLMHA